MSEISKSTVSRELSRNSKDGPYDAARAGKMSLRRRQQGAYKMKGEVLPRVKSMLSKRHSPEQISGRFEQQYAPGVSHETIYQHVYRDKKRGGTLYQNLRFGHKKHRNRLLYQGQILAVSRCSGAKQQHKPIALPFLC